MIQSLINFNNNMIIATWMYIVKEQPYLWYHTAIDIAAYRKSMLNLTTSIYLALDKVNFVIFDCDNNTIMYSNGAMIKYHSYCFIRE